MDVIKNILGALLLVILGVAMIGIAIAVFGAIVGFVLWLFVFAVPEIVFTIGGFIIIVFVLVLGFCIAYQIVDDYRHNRW